MAEIPPIAGVTLEQYAQLCAAMAEVEDEAEQLAMAAEAGVDADSWTAAKDGFTAKMSDPADMGKTAMAFMPLYQAAQAAARGGGPPCTLELYAEISTSYSFERDEHDEQVPPALIFARHGISAANWNEYTGYWTPRVNDPNDPVSQEFPKLVQAESDRIFGIHRDASGSRVDPDDEDASAEDRAAARAAVLNARRPTDENPSARSPGAGGVGKLAAPKPVAPSAPSAPKAATPPPLPAAAPPPPPKAAPPAPEKSAPKADQALGAKPGAGPAPIPPPPKKEVSPRKDAALDDPSKVLGLTDEEKMWAAAAHGCGLIGFAIFGALVIYLVHNQPDKSAYVAHKAKQAAIVQAVAISILVVISVVTCGMGSVLMFPYMALEGYMAYLAYEGKKAGYPGLPEFEGRGMATD